QGRSVDGGCDSEPSQCKPDASSSPSSCQLCNISEECLADQICSEGCCVAPCMSNSDCDAGGVCSADGECQDYLEEGPDPACVCGAPGSTRAPSWPFAALVCAGGAMLVRTRRSPRSGATRG